MDLRQALDQLDPANDEHWTADGLPRMDALVAILGDATITRAAVTAAAPGLNRTTAAGQADLALGMETEAEVEADVAPEQDADGAGDAEPQAGADREPEGADDGEPVAVLDMPLPVVLQDPALIREALVALDVRNQENVREKKALEQRMASDGRSVSILERALVGHERNRKNDPKAKPIRDYLKAQTAARAERAERTKAFLSANVDPRDVAKQLRGASPLDAAMSARKAVPGSTRPAVRKPA